jgi:hypothetical protein
MSAIVYIEPPVPPALDFHDAVSNIKLTAAEKKTVQAARDKLAAATDIAYAYADSYSCSNQGKEWPLQRKIWDACDEFLADPSEATAERVAVVVAMAESAKVTSAELQNVLHQLHQKLSTELQPIAGRVIDAAVAVIEPQIATARTALTSAPGLGAEVKSFDQRVARLHEIIADERAVAERDALTWIGVNCEV